ncbi:MAG: hypothetical protein AB8H79_04630 [Myxococcota bacterium]
MTKMTVLTVFCLGALACGAPADPFAGATEDGGSTAKMEDGSPEALGVIAFLNDADTTYEMLDTTVGLDRRAAESIIAHRNGPDGTLGWLKDSLFTSIDEVDDCYYVGGTALGLLEDWAIDNGWVALDDDDVLGTFDGVEFTLGQAKSTVLLANTAGKTYLDDDLGLDARAVKSIVAARPIANVEDLAELYYVGKSALTTLKEDADSGKACDTKGWDIEYVYDNGDGAWRDELPASLVDIIDDTLDEDEWCGPATDSPWFVKATVDLFDCEAKGYTIELGQYMLEYPSVSWYIEFEVDADFDWKLGTCEV